MSSVELYKSIEYTMKNSDGKEENITGFKYLPDQGLWNPGIIMSYQFYVSNDNKEWKLVDEGEFPKSKTIHCGKQKNSRLKKPAISG